MEMTIRSRDFWKSVPIQYVSDGFIVSKTGDITIGWEITLPGIFSCDARSLLEIPESLCKAISFLPPWMMVHRQDVYYRRGYKGMKSDTYLGGKYQRHFQGRGYLVHRQYIYLTLTSKQSALRAHSSNGLFLLHFLSGKVAKEGVPFLRDVSPSVVDILPVDHHPWREETDSLAQGLGDLQQALRIA